MRRTSLILLAALIGCALVVCVSVPSEEPALPIASLPAVTFASARHAAELESDDANESNDQGEALAPPSAENPRIQTIVRVTGSLPDQYMHFAQDELRPFLHVYIPASDGHARIEERLVLKRCQGALYYCDLGDALWPGAVQRLDSAQYRFSFGWNSAQSDTAISEIGLHLYELEEFSVDVAQLDLGVFVSGRIVSESGAPIPFLGGIELNNYQALKPRANPGHLTNSAGRFEGIVFDDSYQSWRQYGIPYHHAKLPFDRIPFPEQVAEIYGGLVVDLGDITLPGAVIRPMLSPDQIAPLVFDAHSKKLDDNAIRPICSYDLELERGDTYHLHEAVIQVNKTRLIVTPGIWAATQLVHFGEFDYVETTPRLELESGVLYDLPIAGGDLRLRRINLIDREDNMISRAHMMCLSTSGVYVLDELWELMQETSGECWTYARSFPFLTPSRSGRAGNARYLIWSANYMPIEVDLADLEFDARLQLRTPWKPIPNGTTSPDKVLKSDSRPDSGNARVLIEHPGQGVPENASFRVWRGQVSHNNFVSNAMCEITKDLSHEVIVPRGEEIVLSGIVRERFREYILVPKRVVASEAQQAIAVHWWDCGPDTNKTRAASLAKPDELVWRVTAQGHSSELQVMPSLPLGDVELSVVRRADGEALKTFRFRVEADSDWYGGLPRSVYDWLYYNDMLYEQAREK